MAIKETKVNFESYFIIPVVCYKLGHYGDDHEYHHMVPVLKVHSWVIVCYLLMSCNPWMSLKDV